jgi:putative sterol carrier protein
MNKIVNRIISITNRDIDIAELQMKYKATKGKIIQGRLTDVDKVFYIQIHNGSVNRLKEPKNIDGWFETDTSTMINIFMGKIKVMNPATGEEGHIPYDPIAAVRYGDIRVHGDASSADLLLFANHVYKDVYPQMRESLNGEVEKLEKEVKAHA